MFLHRKKSCKGKHGKRIDQVLSTFQVLLLMLKNIEQAKSIFKKCSKKRPTPLPPQKNNGPSLGQTGKTFFLQRIRKFKPISVAFFVHVTSCFVLLLNLSCLLSASQIFFILLTVLQQILPHRSLSVFI